MAFDIFNAVFSGHLAADAVQRDIAPYEEGKKNRVINFTLGVNINEKTTLFLKCSYWTSSSNPNNSNDQNIDPEKTKQELISRLTKGKKIIVESRYAKNNSSSSTTAEGVIKYENIEFTVEKIVIP